MKILVVSNMYPNEKNPTYGVFVKNFCEIIAKSNINFDKIVITKAKGKFEKIKKYFKFCFSVMKNARKKEYDYIYIHYASHTSIPLVLLSFFKKDLNIITNIHGSDAVPENKFQELLQIFVKRILKISKKIVVPSNYYKNLVGEKFSISKEKIFIFPSAGVNSKVFYNISDRKALYKKYNLSEEYKYFGYVSRIDYKKGWDVFLDSLHKLKNEGKLTGKKAIVVGSGKQYNAYLNKVKEYKLEKEIIYFHTLPQEQLGEIFNCMDVMIFPTMREGESLGLVGLEAMATGTPVIGSDYAGLKDYIEDGVNSFLFNVGDYIGLSNKISEFFNLNKNIINDIKENAMETSKKYDRENIEDIIIDIIKS